jgi:hypothetical protein
MEFLAYRLADYGWQKEERGDADWNTGPCCQGMGALICPRIANQELRHGGCCTDADITPHDGKDGKSSACQFVFRSSERQLDWQFSVV